MAAPLRAGGRSKGFPGQCTRFALVTFGCRCNQADSAGMRDLLCRRSRDSMSECENPRDADLIIVNTCTVTHRSDQQVRQAVRRLHRENPEARVVVTGCYAERDPHTLASIPGVDLVVGNAGKERLLEILDGPLGKEGPGPATIHHEPLREDRDCLLPPMAQTGGKTRPIVKLQDGCDARCSYCIVPLVRGPGRSAHPEDAIAEITDLVKKGFQEIVLTGVHLGSYGRGITGHIRLGELLERIAAIPGLGRIRLSSIEPMEFEPSIIRLAARNPVFAPHFHIPMQNGSNRILRRMRRPYTAERIESLFLRIHQDLPDAGIGTDVLVGFPGETEEDFSETCTLIEHSPLSYLHVFPFSPRKGTEAFSFSDRVPPAVVKRRLAALVEISRAKNLAFRRRFLGSVLPAITLAREENLGGGTVLTGNYIHAAVRGLELPPNRLVNVRIDEALPNATLASII